MTVTSLFTDMAGNIPFLKPLLKVPGQDALDCLAAKEVVAPTPRNPRLGKPQFPQEASGAVGESWVPQEASGAVGETWVPQEASVAVGEPQIPSQFSVVLGIPGSPSNSLQ